MTRFIPFALLLAAATFATTAPAATTDGDPADTCTEAPVWFAEGQANDPNGQAAELAEKHARDVARGWCENLGEGHPVFLELQTQETGDEAVTHARFACSNDC